MRCASCRTDFFVTLADDVEPKEASPAVQAPPAPKPAKPQSADDALAAEWAMAEQVEYTPQPEKVAADPAMDQEDLDKLFAAEEAAASVALATIAEADGAEETSAAPASEIPAAPEVVAAKGWRRFLPWRRKASTKTKAKVPAHKARSRAAPQGKTKPPQKTSGPSRALMALGAASIVILIGAFWQREAVARMVPASATLFEAAGLPVNIRGLSFANVRSSLQSEGGSQFLLVEGTVTSLKQSALQVPLIEIRVRSGDGKVLYTWTTDPPRSSLNPGEALHFRARLATPPEAGRDVEVRFADHARSAAAKR